MPKTVHCGDRANLWRCVGVVPCADPVPCATGLHTGRIGLAPIRSPDSGLARVGVRVLQLLRQRLSIDIASTSISFIVLYLQIVL
jgi:hypothetical protein